MEKTLIEQQIRGRISVITIDYPPLNVLGSDVRAALQQALEDADASNEVDAIILTGAGGNFTAGADIQEFATDAKYHVPLPLMIDRIERCRKPVIAAIDRICFGGGTEIAIACHHRIATPRAKLCLPEVKLGLLPGAGGTQRLPRLVGAAKALSIMAGGKPVAAEEALSIGLVDHVVEGGADLIDAVLSYIAEHDLTVRRTGDLPPADDLKPALAAFRANLSPHALSKAPHRIADCVEASDLPYADGRPVEARLFDELSETEASRALRHAFFGQRIVSHVPGLSRNIETKRVKTVGIVGGGLMGSGITIALLNAGLKVILVEMNEAARVRAKAKIEKTIGRDVEKGRIGADVAARRLAALGIADSLTALSSVDLVIEAIYEDMNAKQQIFEGLDAIVPADAILASNTSTLDLDRIAESVADPARVVGLHFFSPANIMPLLEVVRGEKTGASTLASAMAFAKQIGKVGVVSGVCDGFIGSRMFEEYLRQATFLLEEGASPAQIDGALERWGMAMGPMRTIDLAGHDIGLAIRTRRAVEQPERPYSGIFDALCERGWLGQKSGKGIYLYSDGFRAEPHGEAEALFAEYAAAHDIQPRQIGDDEIVSRCVLALVNEGAKILEEGIALRPVDIDIVYLNGYGFAAERGGPMFQADEIGLADALVQIREYAAGRNGWAWQPAKLIEKLAEDGGCFADLNR